MKQKKFLEDLKSNNLFSTSDKLINVTLLPTFFPKIHFIKVKNIQKIFVKLIYCCMKDTQITLQSCDDKLVKLLQEIIKQKPKKEIEFLFFRSDFLLEKFKNEMKLVEINTISCAFLVYGPLLNKIHCKETDCLISESKNEFVKQVKYCKEIFEQKYTSKDCVALMIDNSVDENNSNYFEKKILIDELKKENILLYYICEKDFINIKFENQNMFYKNNQVFFVYYRWYYNYDHFNQNFIDLKIKIEKSNVISLPSAELQLIGSKFFQYIFTDELILQKYLTNEEIQSIKPHFVKIKPKEEFVHGDESKFLIKSFSEGGNNLLDSVNENCFLMEKINSVTLYNKFSDGREGQTIPEIGVFGVGLVLDDQIVFGKDAGYIVRSKMEDSKECGVSCVYGALSSIKFEE